MLLNRKGKMGQAACPLFNKQRHADGFLNSVPFSFHLFIT
ncbi:hypothetical protein BSM4216_3164 [Bacillus smithii]|nr:hypothetical protein BSM4216_3164 [Bacillus smithii]